MTDNENWTKIIFGRDYTDFIKTWLHRSKRQRKYVDEADRFICLWIAFNAWLKQHYGEEWKDTELLFGGIRKKGNDTKKTDGLAGSTEFNTIFDELQSNDKRYNILLDQLKNEGKICDMRYPDDDSKAEQFLGDFKTFIKVVYQIRCNLFHGRKNPDDKDTPDYRLIILAYKLLLPFFEEILKSIHIEVE